MHNYRKNPRHIKHGAMDGVIHNAPGRQHEGGAWPTHRKPVEGGQVRSAASPTIDDFKRAEGFHPTMRPQTSIDQVAKNPESHKVAKAKTQGRQGSLLHMTLPGGGLKEPRRSRRNKNKDVKKGKWPTFRKWAKRTALVTAGLVVLLGGYLFLKGYFNLQKIFKGGGNATALQENVSPDLLKGEGDGRVNVLLLGKGGEGHAGADLTDTILLASIDPVNKTAALVSIPRDLWYTTSSGSSKINAVYANAKSKSLRGDKDKAKAEAAGIKAIQDAVNKVLGVSVHYYAMVDFAGFKQAVDIVGGVDINVPADLAVSERLWDSTTGKQYYLNVPAGQQHFDSTKALYFTRSRHTSKRGDFDRAERQRLFITALGQKILSAGTYTNPVKISQLFDAFGSHVSTDFSVSDARRLMEISKGINGDAVASIGLADPPNVLVQTGTISGQSVVVPKAGQSDYAAIQSYVRSKLQDGYILKEKAKVSVLNGTAVAGLAKLKGDELKTYGYNVTTVGDAPTKTYDETVVVDLTGNKKPYTRNYLEKRFGTKAVSKLPDSTIQASGADFVIILGSNAN